MGTIDVEGLPRARNAAYGMIRYDDGVIAQLKNKS